MKLSEELARILPPRRRRRAPDDAPREIVPTDEPGAMPVRAYVPGDPFDEARERLRSEIPPVDDEL